MVLGNNKVGNINVEMEQLLIVWIKEASNINLEIWFQLVKRISMKKLKICPISKKNNSFPDYVRIFEWTRSLMIVINVGKLTSKKNI
jgi:hypothetical protein